jgi:uncharacterized membrane protein (DUF485 family)
MKTSSVQQPVAIACLFTWIGFVGAISFIEAWLKFQAPGVTLPIGLGIGKLVFAALNKVEWVFIIVVCSSALLYSRPLLTTANISLAFITAILVLQTAWLLPALDIRAEQYINIRQQHVVPSNLHFWFVGTEVLKVTGLFITAVSLFKQP